MMKGLGISGKNFSTQALHHVRFQLRKAIEASWSYVIEKLERWDGLVIKDLC